MKVTLGFLVCAASVGLLQFADGQTLSDNEIKESTSENFCRNFNWSTREARRIYCEKNSAACDGTNDGEQGPICKISWTASDGSLIECTACACGENEECLPENGEVVEHSVWEFKYIGWWKDKDIHRCTCSSGSTDPPMATDPPGDTTPY